MKYISVSFIILIILLTGCKDNCLKSTGDIVREKREPGYFSSIVVHDNINLIISPDPVQQVEVEAGENLIGNITTEVSNYQLIIRNNNKCDWMRSYDKKINVYVSQPDFIELYNYSYADIQSSGTLVSDSLIIHNYGNGKLNMNIQCDKLRVDTNHLGDVIISGQADKVNAHCFRLARLDTRNLICQELEILSEAEGDLFVYAENSLKATIKSIGNIYYYGNPSLTDFTDMGEGNMIAGN